MGEGEPTGITLEDLYNEDQKFVTYEGRRMMVVGRWVEDERVTLKLDPYDVGGPSLLLYGYFDGDELMEEDREVIP